MDSCFVNTLLAPKCLKFWIKNVFHSSYRRKGKAMLKDKHFMKRERKKLKRVNAFLILINFYLQQKISQEHKFKKTLKICMIRFV